MKSQVLFVVVLLAVLCASASALRVRSRAKVPETPASAPQPLDISADAPETPATPEAEAEDTGDETEEEFSKKENTLVREYTYKQGCPLKYCPEDDIMDTAPAGYLVGEYTLNMTVTCGEYSQSFEKQALEASEYSRGNYLRASFEQEVWAQKLLDAIYHMKGCEEGPTYNFEVKLYKNAKKDATNAAEDKASASAASAGEGDSPQEIPSEASAVVDKLFPQKLNATFQSWKGFEICPRVGEVKSATYIVRPDYEAEPFKSFSPDLDVLVNQEAKDQMRSLALRRARATFMQEHPAEGEDVEGGDRAPDSNLLLTDEHDGVDEANLINAAKVPEQDGGKERRAYELFMQEQQLGAMDPRTNWVRFVSTCRAPSARQVYKTDESIYLGFTVEYYINDVESRMHNVSERFDALVEEYENKMEKRWIDAQTESEEGEGEGEGNK